MRHQSKRGKQERRSHFFDSLSWVQIKMKAFLAISWVFRSVGELETFSYSFLIEKREKSLAKRRKATLNTNCSNHFFFNFSYFSGHPIFPTLFLFLWTPYFFQHFLYCGHSMKAIILLTFDLRKMPKQGVHCNKKVEKSSVLGFHRKNGNMPLKSIIHWI